MPLPTQTRTVPPLAADEMRAWRAFIQVATRALDRLDHELQSAHDLTLGDYEILVSLSEEPEHRLQMSTLAEKSLVSQSRLTYRVDRLEKRGYVERVPCPTDGRRVWAQLTDSGFAALEAAYPTHLEGVRRYVVDPVAPRDLGAATRALEAMLGALD
jgi:DNA-binding MarR family transcriptional regulator